ncbi:MAG: hypothetical protein ACE5JD_00820 [Candidatus Methylomirabilia bacterium]
MKKPIPEPVISVLKAMMKVGGEDEEEIRQEQAHRPVTVIFQRTDPRIGPVISPHIHAASRLSYDNLSVASDRQ